MDKIPAKGASLGKRVRGPFTKNFVIPNEEEKRLRMNAYTDNGSSILVWPNEVFG